MKFPLYKGLINLFHGVNDQLYQSAVQDAGFLPDAIESEHVPNLTFAVRARCAQVFINLRSRLVREGVEYLLHLFSSGNEMSPALKIVR